MIRLFVCAAALGACMYAQSPALSGKFVLAEESADSTTLGLLTFDPAGTVTGTEYVQASGVTQSMAVTGIYTVASDGSGTLILNTEVTTEDGPAPAVAATYDFAAASAGGFAALRREGSQAAIARLLPAAAVSPLNAAFVFEAEGASRSGQRVASLGVLKLKGDGSLAGKLATKRAAVIESAVVAGSYIFEGSTFGLLRLAIPGSDEDGNVVTADSVYIFLVTAKREVIALGVENGLPGLSRLTAAQ